MPAFEYYCTAQLDAEGRHQKHAIDVDQKRIDADEPEVHSRMGSTRSAPGEPPRVLFCDEHQGWATLAPIEMDSTRSANAVQQ